MCVDFAGKEFDGSKKWGLQNAKLRTSRKLLFAGGLLPTLECFTLPKSEMVDFLTVEFLKPPLDRIASAFLRHNESDAGARFMTAYDDFLQILDSGEERNKLSSLSRDQARDSELFNKTKDIGGRIESGLLALLFSPGDLSDVSRRYLIF